eukprot:4502635-Prymnesium_polylepis.1
MNGRLFVCDCVLTGYEDAAHGCVWMVVVEEVVIVVGRLEVIVVGRLEVASRWRRQVARSPAVASGRQWSLVRTHRDWRPLVASGRQWWPVVTSYWSPVGRQSVAIQSPASRQWSPGR